MHKLKQIGSYDELVSKIQQHEKNVLQLTQDFRNFVQANLDPRISPNFKSKGRDDLSVLIKVVDLYFHHCVIILLVLKSVKILTRKPANRRNVDLTSLDMLQRIIVMFSHDSQICVEFANGLFLLLFVYCQRDPSHLPQNQPVILNICYERENVAKIIGKGCVTYLINLISDDDHLHDYKLMSAVVGAIQSICFVPEGKECIREMGGAKPIVNLLSCTDANVRSRAVGALHNLSSDLKVVSDLRDYGAIPDLIHLLRDPIQQIAASAAGCLQNISREEKSRSSIEECGGVSPLMDLLFVNHLAGQTCAAGALLNIMGPLLGKEIQSNPERQAFKKLISNCIFLGQIQDLLDPD